MAYQYHLKDHLGNVRVTFTIKDEIEQTLATLETTNEHEERANFLKQEARLSAKPLIFVCAYLLPHSFIIVVKQPFGSNRYITNCYTQ